MKKRLIILSVILVVLILVIIIVPSFNKQDIIRDSLTSFGFTASSDNLFYKKDLSDSTYDDYIKYGDTYDNLTFSFDNYTLTRNIMSTIDDVDSTYNFTYDYISSNINFIARYVYKDSNSILKGSYNTKNEKYTCEYEIGYLVDTDMVKDELCNDIKKYIIETEDLNNKIFNENAIFEIKEKSED